MITLVLSPLIGYGILEQLESTGAVTSADASGIQTAFTVFMGPVAVAVVGLVFGSMGDKRQTTFNLYGLLGYVLASLAVLATLAGQYRF